MNRIKETLLGLVIADIEKQVETAKQGRKDAIEESRAHKGAMASRYDTFKEEAQYLASGFTVRIQELFSQLAALKSMQTWITDKNNKVSGGTIIEVEDADMKVRTKYFILAAGGGEVYKVAGEQYTILTVRAPLAQTLFDKTKGDEAEIIIQGKVKHLLIVSVF